MEQQKEIKQKLSCETVRDLLPLYIDKITSDQSNRSINEHLQECEPCRQALDEMRSPLTVETAPEIRDFKKYLKMSRLEILIKLMESAAVIAVITCFIVNLAVERRLSWFYIVLAGLSTAYLPAETALRTKTHRFEKYLAMLTVCVPILVGTVQLVQYTCMGDGEIWFFDKAVPIMALWLAIVWIATASNRIGHLDWVLSIGILCTLAVLGNYLTNRIAGQCSGLEDYLRSFVSNGLGNSVIAVIMLAWGGVREGRKRKKQSS